jgi:hypothetical protein
MRGRQRAKIREFRGALVAAGLRTLDKQAAVLMLSRSTTWTLLKGKHKGSGISAAIIIRMLLSPRLPPPVRTTILQYVAEKTAGLYGDSELRLRKFTAQLSRRLMLAIPTCIRSSGVPRRIRRAQRIEPSKQLR